ncbi:peptidyl-prolyl cis-trans isomerase [Deferribacterales bacterium]|nr:peptidyl-prolyl cis-trans isomerase [Deferribacterales bacterium]
MELYPDKAPITVKNFTDYVKAGYYSGTIFHRVIPGFMIQGGGMTVDMVEKSGQKPPIKNEAANGLRNAIGTVAMARTNVPDSATSQFFINVNNNSFLDYQNNTMQGIGYAVFGKVIAGMDVVNKIAQVQTGNKGMHQDVPTKTVEIIEATLQFNAPATKPATQDKPAADKKVSSKKATDKKKKQVASKAGRKAKNRG